MSTRIRSDVFCIVVYGKKQVEMESEVDIVIFCVCVGAHGCLCVYMCD